MYVALTDGPHKGTYELRGAGPVVFVSNGDGTMDIYEESRKRAREYAHAGRRGAWVAARAPRHLAWPIRRGAERR